MPPFPGQQIPILTRITLLHLQRQGRPGTTTAASANAVFALFNGNVSSFDIRNPILDSSVNFALVEVAAAIAFLSCLFVVLLLPFLLQFKMIPVTIILLHHTKL